MTFSLSLLPSAVPPSSATFSTWYLVPFPFVFPSVPQAFTPRPFHLPSPPYTLPSPLSFPFVFLFSCFLRYNPHVRLSGSFCFLSQLVHSIIINSCFRFTLSHPFLFLSPLSVSFPGSHTHSVTLITNVTFAPLTYTHSFPFTHTPSSSFSVSCPISHTHPHYYNLAFVPFPHTHSF